MFSNCIKYLCNCTHSSRCQSNYKEKNENQNVEKDVFYNISVLSKYDMITPNNTPSVDSSEYNCVRNISPAPYLRRDGSPDPNVNVDGKEVIFSGGTLMFIKGIPTYVIKTGIYDEGYEIALYYNIDATRLRRIGYYTYDDIFIEYEIE